MVVHGVHLVIAVISCRWGGGGRALSGDWGGLVGPGEDRGLVALQGPTSRGKSARLAEGHPKLKCFGAVHPGRATVSGAWGCGCIHSPPTEMGRDKSSPGGVWAVILTLAVRN